MFDFDKHLADLSQQTVLCIGDVMLDEFVYGDVTRISPEAPTPVIAVKRTEIMIGGAGNVARNLVALGARCVFIGVVGGDDAGKTLSGALSAHPRIEHHLATDPQRMTTRKVRFVSEHHSSHLLRADWEMAAAIDAATEDALIASATKAMPGAGAVVLSDYAKGALTPRVVRAVIDAAIKAGKPVIVDPKGRDYSIYKGATLITPNRQELAAATNTAARSDDEVANAARGLKDALGAKAILVTRSEDGMTLVGDGAPIHVPSYAVKVRDVSGAGDTVVAVLSAMLAMQADFESAMRAANAAAAVVVGKPGTATLSAEELRHRILPEASLASEEKIVFDWAMLGDHLDVWRRQGLRIGFTNGVFDLLHPGHVKLLAQSRAACDRLVVGLNSDASVTRLKGPTRPVQSAQSRAEVLAALEAVDLVVVFEQDTPRELITQVKPTILVKGSDYTREQVVGHDIVEALGGQVVLVDLVSGQSTTSMIERSRGGKGREVKGSSHVAATSHQRETQMVAEFFGGKTGFFVEVGANEPRLRSQTFHLEQAGWTGVLVEPQPDLVAQLRDMRTAQVFGVACSGPQNAGQTLPFYVAGPLSSLDRSGMAPGAQPEAVINVPVRTLDSILEEAKAPQGFDFLSIDVEGHELDVLSGFSLSRWQPRLVMLEDHVAGLSKHNFLLKAGYRIIRRYENNGWYVPRSSPAKMALGDVWEIVRKYYLALPIRKLRNLSRLRRGTIIAAPDRTER